ncbi:MAG: glycosyltransferase family 4 protein [Acidobacteriota bacterium]
MVRQNADTKLGRIAILGHPTSIFGIFLGECLTRQGWEVSNIGWESKGIATRDEWPFQVVNLWDQQRGWRRFLRVVSGFMCNQVDRLFLALGQPMTQGWDHLGELDRRPPSLNYALHSAIAMARWVRREKPRCVFALEAYPHGLAAALCDKTTRVVMPWGSDIFRYAEASPLVRWLLKWTLRRAHLVCPGAVSAARELQARFRLRPQSVVAAPWGVDRSLFRPRGEGEKRELRRKVGVAEDGLVVLNVRRFAPLWGCHEVLEVMLILAQQRNDCQCVLFGGAGEKYAHLVRAARERVEALGLTARFHFLPAEVSLEACAEWMAMADVFLSLHRDRDMRSWSIVQAAACGAAPVLSDQAEYRCMEEEGFRALFVDPSDTWATVRAVVRYAEDANLRARIRALNLRYVATREDVRVRMRALQEAVLEAVERREMGRRTG